MSTDEQKAARSKIGIAAAVVSGDAVPVNGEKPDGVQIQFQKDLIEQRVRRHGAKIEEEVKKQMPKNMLNGVLQYLSMTLNLCRHQFDEGIELAFIAYHPEKEDQDLSITHATNLIHLQKAVNRLVEFQKAQAIEKQV